ncbi:MAG: leucyl aminopeptidase [Acidimicrobiales bacterium]
MREVVASTSAPADTVAVGIPVVAIPAPTAGGGADSSARLERLSGLERVEGRPGEVVRRLLGDDTDDDWLWRQGFRAEPGQSLVLRIASGAPSVVLVGLGAREDVDAERWRRAGAALVRAAGQRGGAAAMLVPDDPPGGDEATVSAAIAEGAILAAYRFDAHRSTPQPEGLDTFVVVGAEAGGRLADGARRGSAAAAAVAFARDLVNTPPSDLTPRRLADAALERLGSRPRTTVEVWDEDRIAAERLGGLLAVARGSSEPPRLVRATYEPDGEARAHVVLVGKGITFDSGGLSLKPPEGMMTMKTDMTGAAVVLAAVSACAELSVPVKVTAIAPITENMPGGSAQKPGDVFTARNGKTVEVLNTDAEGRLVLADGLSLAAELSPDAIIDVATLTGAQVVALGTGIGALMGTDDHLLEALQAAGARAGERFWPLPLPDDYDEHIESEIADMKNIGRPREAGTIAAAMLLKRFVGDLPWAHLDIAGPARSAESSGYLTKGATAFGVRALLDLLQHFPGAS